MPQFDVYRNPDPASSAAAPYLLDIQSELLAGLATRVVVPLFYPEAFTKPARILNPLVTVEGHQVVMATQELAGLARQHLGERVDSLTTERSRIIAALDLLFTGI